MKAEELPLFELYTRLQEAGLPLGLNEYAQLIKALQAGFGLPDQQALSRLCRTLWVKNDEETHIFDYHFAEVIGVKPLSYADIAMANTQQSAFNREIAFTQQLTAQTTRFAFFGASAALLIFTLVLVGRQFMSNRLEIIQPFLLQNPQLLVTPDFNIEPESLTDPIPQPDETTSNPSIFLLISLIGSILLGTELTWSFTRKLIISRKIPSTLDKATSTLVPPPISQAEITHLVDDEMQLAGTLHDEQETFAIQLLSQGEYFPLTRRQMKQGWRHLRRNLREGLKTELDIAGTVNQIGRQGLFLQPVMRAPKINSADLFFLLDYEGSMVPFHALSERLINTAIRAGHLDFESVYYFHNCPGDYLYHDFLMQDPEPVSYFLNERLSPKSVVAIMSDAGAARGGFNPVRVRKTEAFLARISRRVRYSAWLNPLPRDLWEKTTAEEVAHLVSMFEVNRVGFQSAIDVLRGRWKPVLKYLQTT
ncbi:MAG: hypothetical protein F6K42_14655 [Leptolyngbya sp. SIO1D8]|nr:hypothetical protein [Leptolyngbya sp. SIO1D8]